VVDIHAADHPVAGGWGRVARIELQAENVAYVDQIVAVEAVGETFFAGFHGMEKVLVIGRDANGVADWQVSQTLVAPDAGLFDRFGEAVSGDEEWLAVGAPDESAAGDLKGAVYLFKKSAAGWGFAQKLLPPSPASNSSFDFGRRLSLSGEWLAAGDSGGDITIHRRNNNGQWTFFQKIIALENYDDFHLKGQELLCGSVSVSLPPNAALLGLFDPIACGSFLSPTVARCAGA
jgi:hypothetical protein